jgi:DNA-binding MarR family transcriptional regulator
MQLHEFDTPCVMDKDGKLDEIEIAAWARLLKASARLVAAVERDLKAAGLPPLGWYDALLELNRAGADGLRPGDLEREMLLPQYNVSRLVDRLETAGYTVRRSHPADGRGQVLQITGEGRELSRRMWRVYRRTIAETFAAKLGKGEAGRLAELLQKLAPEH